MKDRVFIAWSGSNHVAIQVKNILEKQYNYVCSIGGNSDNNSRFSSVGDTVIQQIKSCNQAIVIFQNRKDGAVSNNLFFELGYVLSMYGQKKVLCVKKAKDDVVLPSDFDNSFIESIEDNPEVEENFAQGIVDYFISRQKMSINENKMYLINNRYLIHDKIVSHYSETGSKCSDYELAQYILFYMQAAHMFGDETKVYKEILEFKNTHNFEFSSELSLSVNLCLSFFEMVFNINIANNAESDVYIDQNVFWKVKNDYSHYIKSVKEDELGIFDEWVSVFIYEHLAFSYMLIANNPEIDDNMKTALHQKTIYYANQTLAKIGRLEQRAPCKENNDTIGLISLLKAYVYRNLYLSKVFLQEADADDWLKKTMRERESLKNNFGKGTIDTQLYNNFCMEYYLSLVNYLSSNQKDNFDDFEIMMFKSEINAYLNSIRKDNTENAYLKQIAHWCNNI